MRPAPYRPAHTSRSPLSPRVVAGTVLGAVGLLIAAAAGTQLLRGPDAVPVNVPTAVDGRVIVGKDTFAVSGVLSGATVRVDPKLIPAADAVPQPGADRERVNALADLFGLGDPTKVDSTWTATSPAATLTVTPSGIWTLYSTAVGSGGPAAQERDAAALLQEAAAVSGVTLTGLTVQPSEYGAVTARATPQLGNVAYAEAPFMVLLGNGGVPLGAQGVMAGNDVTWQPLSFVDALTTYPQSFVAIPSQVSGPCADVWAPTFPSSVNRSPAATTTSSDVTGSGDCSDPDTSVVSIDVVIGSSRVAAGTFMPQYRLVLATGQTVVLDAAARP